MPRGWRPGRVRLGGLGGPRARSRHAEGTQAWRLGALPRGTGVGPSPSSQPSGSPPRGLPLMRGETISNQRASQARACSPPCEPEYLLHWGGVSRVPAPPLGPGTIYGDRSDSQSILRAGSGVMFRNLPS